MDLEKLDNLINEIIDKISTKLKSGYSEDAVELIKTLTALIFANLKLNESTAGGEKNGRNVSTKTEMDETKTEKY